MYRIVCTTKCHNYDTGRIAYMLWVWALSSLIIAFALGLRSCPEHSSLKGGGSVHVMIAIL